MVPSNPETPVELCVGERPEGSKRSPRRDRVVQQAIAELFEGGCRPQLVADIGESLLPRGYRGHPEPEKKKGQ